MTATIDKGVLLPYQKAWIADTAEVKVIEKSRRIGISWAEAADSSLFASRTKGDDVWYIGYNKEMAKEFIDDCAFWAKHYNLAAAAMEEVIIADDLKDILTYRITFTSGHSINALSSRPKNLRGKGGRGIIDEAAFHEDLPGLIKAVMAFLMWGGTARIISTHFGDDNPFNDLVEDIRKKKKPYSLHRVTFDEACEQGLCKQIFMSRGLPWSPEAEVLWRQKMIDFYGDAADEELHVIPSGGSGTYLSRAMILNAMDADIPVIRWKCDQDFAQKPEAYREGICQEWLEETLEPILEGLDPNLKTFFGEDFGRSGDLTVLLPAQEQKDLSYRSICAIELRNVPFKQQEQILFYLVDRLPRFAGGAMDARGNGQYLAEVAMQRYGMSRILQVMPSQPWYREAMPKYKAHLEDQTLILPKDSDLLADNRLVRMEKGIAKVPDKSHTKGSDGGQRHGDGAIAGAMLAYAIEACEGSECEYESVGKRHFATRGAY